MDNSLNNKQTNLESGNKCDFFYFGFNFGEWGGEGLLSVKVSLRRAAIKKSQKHSPCKKLN